MALVKESAATLFDAQSLIARAVAERELIGSQCIAQLRIAMLKVINASEMACWVSYTSHSLQHKCLRACDNVPLALNARLHTELDLDPHPHRCSCKHKLRLNYTGEEAEVKAHPQAQRGTRRDIDLEHGAGHRCAGAKILVIHTLTLNALNTLTYMHAHAFTCIFTQHGFACKHFVYVSHCHVFTYPYMHT